MPLVRDKAYLDYDPKAEYEKVLQAAQGLLAPSGFHKSKGNFYRLWEGGAYMECNHIQTNWMRLGCGCAQGEGTLGSKGSHERRCALLAADWPSDQRL